MKLKFIFLLVCSIFISAYPLSAQYRHEIALTAIFQDEAPYIKEWIEYYKLLGVEHFYLYNNLSDDNYLEVLSPYISNGEVELIEWNYPSKKISDWDPIQIAAYADAVNRSKDIVKWLVVVDMDEFIVPIKADTLNKFLRPFETNKNIGGVCIQWVLFGTSHVAAIPEGKLLIETLLLNSGPLLGGNVSKIKSQGFFKSIIRPKYVSEVVSPHYCKYIPGKRHTLLNLSMAQINHYWTRDETFLYDIKIPRRIKWGGSKESVLIRNGEMNHKTDLDKPILRFVPLLRQKMGF